MSLEALKQRIAQEATSRWGGKQQFAYALAEMMRVPGEVARRKLHLLLSPKGGLSGWWEPIARLTDTRLEDYLTPAERSAVLAAAKPLRAQASTLIEPTHGGSGARVQIRGASIVVESPDSATPVITIKSATELNALIYALRCAGLDLE